MYDVIVSFIFLVSFLLHIANAIALKYVVKYVEQTTKERYFSQATLLAMGEPTVQTPGMP